ncbi:hypothetical protein PPERSA_06045 [Pseudocohnilembus persalinus]|uniref:Dipeptidyl peptidase 3 n=1 Tax=Pseudocohnilembus persalinus TaxID=266149 RepID=A0A0V0QQK7_PSEPJ|nr:hypothetical protein PPERSA_06045 [Pseudocohnilembus persalinus]|eukprot:KRX04492.1 hypothetical protein PPERSA_06045 [Pseudocohnilembus persalinus]
MSKQNDQPVISTKSNVMGIFCSEEFSLLSEKEQQYTYGFAKAAWEGAKICYFQKSYESPALFIILQLVFSAENQPLSQFKKQFLEKKIGNEEQWNQILAYSAAFFNNCGNFKSFGDSKFVPECSQEIFTKFIQLSNNYETHKSIIDFLWNDIKDFVYGYKGILEKIDYPQKGQTGYYSQNISKEEIDLVDEFLTVMNLDPLNTRVLKQSDSHFQVHFASINAHSTKHQYQGKTIELVYGDYSAFLRRLNQALAHSLQYSANVNQQKMIQTYIEHFQNGNIETHKDSQRHWIRDKGPVVETNIGFIESYLDPKQVRAEFEGFAALVNKKQSAITQKFVDQAPEFLKMLPWPQEFEKDVFLKPDFTSLSILAFGCSGTPLGINIPNYDDIRQDEGFKNVFLGNCLPKMKKGVIQFFDDADEDLQVKWAEQTSFHQVVFHELLGHGCGKLFYKKSQNEYNFDHENVKNPLTGEKITSFYNEKDTWMSVFQNLSNPYEECRADTVALYMSCFPESINALQPQHNDQWKEICYSAYLNFIRMAIQGLEFYNLEAKKFGQAHINGRWVILQVLLEAGNDFIVIEKTKDSNGKDTIKIKMDRDQCLTTGKEALKNFLLKLQVYKSTADFAKAQEMYGNYSKVSDKFLEIRQIVLDNKKPRRLELQGHLERDHLTGKLNYKTFEETFEGVIESYIARYPHFDKEMFDLFIQHQKVNRPNL